MKFEKTQVFNFEGAFRGMRNPMNSWEKSDSLFYTERDDWVYDDYELEDWLYDYLKTENPDFDLESDYDEAIDALRGDKVTFHKDVDVTEVIAIGHDDMKLARQLIEAGGEHRKFLRQIFVSVDITAPLFYWKEFDTYKVATVSNSCSTMHKLASTPITLDCFEIDDLNLIPYNEYAQRSELKYPIDPDFVQMALIPYLEHLRQKYLETKDLVYWKELIRWLPESWLQKRTITLNYENLRNMYHQRKNHKLTEWHSFCRWVEALPYAKELIIN